jgi:hypothetical protein
MFTYFAPWIVRAYDLLEKIEFYFHRVKQFATVDLFQEKPTYVFLKDSLTPIRSTDMFHHSSNIEWYFNSEQSLFYKPGSAAVPKHVALLSADVMNRAGNLYDITPFIEHVKWQGDGEPTLQHLISAWAITAHQKYFMFDGEYTSTIVSIEGNLVNGLKLTTEPIVYR